MNDQDKKRFTDCFSYLCEVFNTKSSKTLFKAYYMSLEKFDISDVEKAIGVALTACRFFPKPVELIELITGGTKRIEDVALIESGKVLKAIKKIGKYRSVCFDNATTQAVIVQTFGGWVKMCSELKEYDEKWFIKDFTASYAAYSRQNIKHLGILSGSTDTNNTHRGFEVKPEISYIGDFEKAKQISMNTEKIDNKLLKLTENIG